MQNLTRTVKVKRGRGFDSNTDNFASHSNIKQELAKFESIECFKNRDSILLTNEEYPQRCKKHELNAKP